MKAVYDFLDAIDGSDSTVLISGESGTGKEVIARRLHERSRRRLRPFVAVSCALFSETLIESELFGHERGAFTGAIGPRPGRFELAEGGTIFLDDIDDVPVAMQVKLLRVLQNHTVERVGGTHTIPVNVRILAATKKDLREMVAGGLFREDLYYRLNVVPIALPPLRARPEDIPALTDHFLARYCRERGKAVPPVSDGVRRAFQLYGWPGNVRELENTCERIAQTLICDAVRSGCVAAGVLFGAADRIETSVAAPATRAAASIAERASDRPEPADDEIAASDPRHASRTDAAGPAREFDPDGPSLDDRLLEFEAGLIRRALEASGGNRTRAALLLKIGRSTLGDRIRRCGIDIARSAGRPAAVPPAARAPRTRAPRAAGRHEAGPSDRDGPGLPER
jgi:transcriptional regulator with GAF, ATPase, and Fis domain